MTRSLALIKLLLVLLLAYSKSPTTHQLNFNLQTDTSNQNQAGTKLTYDVSVNSKPVLVNSSLSIDVDHKILATNPKVKSATPNSVSNLLRSDVPQKSSHIQEEYKELRLELEGNCAVVFRAYNEGVAYRIETSLSAPKVKVYNEEVTLNFAGDYNVYYPKEESFFSHNEREFVYLSLKEIKVDSLASLPAVVDTKAGIKLIIGESDVDDYPGLWLRGNSSNSLSAIFPPYPLKEELKRDRDVRVAQPADYIAETGGTRTFPWRIIGIAEKDADLITNQMVYLLAKPSQIQNTSWIKPGKVAWDWYNANNIYGADFKSGVNTQTSAHRLRLKYDRIHRLD